MIITLDDEGVSRAVGKKLLAKGYDVAYVCYANKKNKPKNCYKLTDHHFETAANIYQKILSENTAPLVGLIHVANNKIPTNESTMAELFDTEMLVLKSAYGMIKHFDTYADKKHSKKNFIFAITRMMDDHQVMGEIDQSIQAGFSGLIKTLSQEWPHIYYRSIDISSDCSKTEAANMTLEELQDSVEARDFIELTRNKAGERFILEKQPFTSKRSVEFLPERNDVFVVTGGARSVTFACILEMAKTWHSKFILLGRTSLKNDLNWTKGETDSEKLQQLLLEEYRAKGEKVKPIEIQATLQQALNQIEIMNHLNQLEKIGCEALYYSCDICDGENVRAVVAEAQNIMGPITGIIHGAGVIRDSQIEKKTETDFELVLNTKVLGLKNCIEAIGSEKIRYLSVFSSTAAVFGNYGQTDYAMANEIMNQVVAGFKYSYPNTHALSINWGAWQGGMMNKTLQQMYEKNGGKAISLELGAKFFAEQFCYDYGRESTQIMIADRSIPIIQDHELKTYL